MKNKKCKMEFVFSACLVGRHLGNLGCFVLGDIIQTISSTLQFSLSKFLCHIYLLVFMQIPCGYFICL